jgi:hypothetical protein
MDLCAGNGSVFLYMLSMPCGVASAGRALIKTDAGNLWCGRISSALRQGVQCLINAQQTQLAALQHVRCVSVVL